MPSETGECIAAVDLGLTGLVTLSCFRCKMMVVTYS